VALGGTMHLRDAMIDAEGNIYGEGRITFPPDPAGVFSAPQGGLVQVNTAGRGSLRFMASHETRETTTGYLRPDTTGPQISLPQGLASLLSEALALSPPANPITFALDSAGRLSTISETDPIRQGLSDWRGSVTYADDALTVRVSAALRSLPTIRSWDELEDPWRADGEEPDRIDVEFRLDAITSVARFGGYWKALAEEREREQVPFVRTSLDAMSLASSPIGFNREIYGVTEDGLYAGIHEVVGLWNSLTLSAPSAASRFTNGLVVGDNRFPRITFEGVNLDVVVGGMWATRTFGLTITSGKIGRIEWSGGGSDGPGRTSNLLEARLEFELGMEGLTFSYSTTPDSTARQGLSGEIVIPWELLVIRSPLFTRHREKLLAGEPPFGSR
jgi:hypothetical protein